MVAMVLLYRLVHQHQPVEEEVLLPVVISRVSVTDAAAIRLGLGESEIAKGSDLIQM